MTEVILQQIFGLVPATVDRYVNFALRILDVTLVTLPRAGFFWPDAAKIAAYSAMIMGRHNLAGRQTHLTPSQLSTELLNVALHQWYFIVLRMVEGLLGGTLFFGCFIMHAGNQTPLENIPCVMD